MAFENLKAKYEAYKQKRATEKIAQEREKSELESAKEKARIEAREQFAQERQARSVEEARQNELNKEKAKEDAIKEAREKEKARLEAPERRKKAFKEGAKKAGQGFLKFIDETSEKAVQYGKKEIAGKSTHKRRPTYGYKARRRLGESDRDFDRRQSTVLRPSHLPVHARPHKHRVRKVAIHPSGKYPEVQWAPRRKHKSRSTSHKRSTRRKRDDGGWFLG